MESIINKTNKNTAQAEENPARGEAREGARPSGGPPTELKKKEGSGGRGELSGRGSRRGTPDVQVRLGGLSLEEQLLKTPPKERTAREGSSVAEEPFYKYESKAEKRRAKAARRKVMGAGEGSGLPGEIFRGKDQPGPSKRGMKLKRQSTDEGRSERPPAKRRNQGKAAAEGPRNVAKANRGLQVAVCREDGVSVEEGLAKLIRKRLTQLIEVVVLGVVRGEPGLVAPRFATSGLVSEGFFLVTPKTTESRDWLLSQDFGVLGGHKIITRKLEQTRVQVWVPGEPDTEYVKEFLYAQNPDRPELKIKEWKAAGSESLQLGTRMTYLVPEGVEESWGEEKVKVLDFSATSVRVRILRANPLDNPKDHEKGEPASEQVSSEPGGIHMEETGDMEVAGSELTE